MNMLKKWNSRPGLLPPALLGVFVILSLILIGIQIYVGGGASDNGDGFGYINAWDIAIRYVRPDSWRTPVYPLVIGLFKEWLPMAVVFNILLVINWLAYIATIALLWNINFRLGLKKSWNIAASVLFYLIPALWIMNNMTQPEVLAGLGVALFIWFTMKLAEKPTDKWLWLITLTIGYLIFLKPVFVCFIPIYLIIAGWFAYRNRHLLRVAILGSVIVVGSVAFYQWQMYRFYQTFGMSHAQNMNTYIMLRQDGLIQPQDIPSDSLRARFIPFYEKDQGMHHPDGWFPYILEVHSFMGKEREAIVNKAVRNHPKEVLAGALHRFVEATTDRSQYYLSKEELSYARGWVIAPPDYIPLFYPRIQWLNPPLFIPWIISLLFLALTISTTINRRRSGASSVVPLEISYLICLLFATLTISSIVGAMNDWGRLTWPVLLLVPGMLMAVGQWLQTKIMILLNKK